MRREIFTVWVLLSAPLVAFIVYLFLALGLTFGGTDGLLLSAMILSIVSLFFLSWLFVSQMGSDWRHCARFMAMALMFEGVVLALTKASTGSGGMIFGVTTFLAGMILVLAARKH